MRLLLLAFICLPSLAFAAVPDLLPGGEASERYPQFTGLQALPGTEVTEEAKQKLSEVVERIRAKCPGDMKSVSSYKCFRDGLIEAHGNMEFGAGFVIIITNTDPRTPQ